MGSHLEVAQRRAARISWVEGGTGWGRKNPQVTLSYLYLNLPFQGGHAPEGNWLTSLHHLRSEYCACRSALKQRVERLFCKEYLSLKFA